jgi:hypothetical protein
MQSKILGKINKCIYCGELEGLTDEHIIPYSLNGNHILQKASCPACCKITSKIEKQVARDFLRPMRAYYGLKTRRTYPNLFSISGKTFNDEDVSISIPISEYGSVVVYTQFSPPAYISKAAYREGISCIGASIQRSGGLSTYDLSKKYHLKDINFIAEYKPIYLARALAKIAYGFAVAKYGLENFEDVYILLSILNLKNDIGMWVGCLDYNHWVDQNEIIKVDFVQSGRQLISRIQFFGKREVSPLYLVVVGKLK